MNFLQKAFNKAYGVAKNRGMISHQLMSLFVSFGFADSLCLSSLFLSVFGRMLLNLIKSYWKSDSPLFDYLQDLTGPLVYALIFAILVMLYYFPA